jgi:hypothetical protein
MVKESFITLGRRYTTTLHINALNSQDYFEYQCVAKVRYVLMYTRAYIYVCVCVCVCVCLCVCVSVFIQIERQTDRKTDWLAN